jgi:hypothetical protein
MPREKGKKKEKKEEKGGERGEWDTCPIVNGWES